MGCSKNSLFTVALKSTANSIAEQFPDEVERKSAPVVEVYKKHLSFKKVIDEGKNLVKKKKR